MSRAPLSCVGRLAADDEARLLAALSRDRARLKSILGWFRIPHEDANDLLHDLALLAIQKFEAIDDLDAWLPGAIRNLCRSHKRKNRRRKCLDLMQCPEPFCTPPQERLGFLSSLNSILVLLPNGPRMCLILRAMGFNRAEIAERTGNTPATVAKLITKGRRKLLAELEARRDTRGEVGGRTQEPATSDFAEILSLRYGRSGTARTYRAALRTFARWQGTESIHAAIEDLLSAGEVAARELAFRYRTALLERGAKANTINVYLCALRAVVRLARQRGQIDWSLEITGVSLSGLPEARSAVQLQCEGLPLLPEGGATTLRRPGRGEAC